MPVIYTITDIRTHTVKKALIPAVRDVKVKQAIQVIVILITGMHKLVVVIVSMMVMESSTETCSRERKDTYEIMNKKRN